MVDVVARLKLKGKTFEIMVDCDKALALKKQKNFNEVSLRDVMAINMVYSDYKKGFKASSSELKDAFSSENFHEIASRILAEGEMLLPQEYREKEREAKLKQIIDFLSKNCIDPRTHAPYTAERITAALKQVGARVDGRNTEEQAMLILKDLEKIIPIKIATIKLKVTVPAAYVGKGYSLFKAFKKEKEDWLGNGDLVCVINLPAGMQLDFYDKLNAITHGSAITEEVKE